MICDLCDKDQQSICERTFHFIKPINECLMRKAQENRKIIEELEQIKAEIEEHNRHYLSDDNAGLERAIWDFIDPRISELKGEN